MTPEDIFNFILNITIWHALKAFIILALLIYLVFAVVMLRQVRIMTNTFRTGFEIPLRLVSWLHLGLVVLIFILAIIIL